MKTELRLPDPPVVEPPPTTRPLSRRWELLWDAAGVALATLLAGWTATSAAAVGGDAVPTVLLLAGCAAAYAAARLLSPFARFAGPSAVVAVAAIVLVRMPADVFERSPFLVPFGYAHFTWAFFVQATVAGLMLAAAPWPLPVRILAGVAALGLATIPFGTIVVGPAVFAVVLLAALLIGRRPWARVAVIACGVVAALGLATTVVLGARYTGLERHGSVEELLHATSNRCRGGECSPAGVEGIEGRVYQSVAERRVALWHDALVLLEEHPAFGVGPGNFRFESPVAAGDPDEPWAHQELLQQGAETGWPGIALLVLLFGWGFARLVAVRRPDAVTVLGAVALALLALHAYADFVLHHPAAPLAAAALLGAAASEYRRLEGS